MFTVATGSWLLKDSSTSSVPLTFNNMREKAGENNDIDH